MLLFDIDSRLTKYIRHSYVYNKTYCRTPKDRKVIS